MLLHEYRFILIFDGDAVPEGFKGNGHYVLGAHALEAYYRLDSAPEGMHYVLDTDQCPWRLAAINTDDPNVIPFPDPKEAPDG